ncbi:MAG: DUF881 domain-containing protein, partial [Armatimonadetes bacterium]|nr:DUF881 domain-containing protein [Armatimonadota bacterium]
MTLAIFVMAFLVVAQLRTSKATTSQVQIPTRNVYAMATLLREEREARVKLEGQVADLREQLASYERANTEGRSLAEAMSKELETIRIALGLKAMRGPGLTVRLADPKTQPKGANPVVVTYQDIVAVINELWAAGAEAIAVSGQRVTATTGLSQVGGSVVVNLQRLDGPFDIAAIGDSFTHGMCVPSGKNFVAIVQTRYPRTLNLGIQGTGPLTQLATLKEYLPFVKPKLVFWFYFERNDLNDLRIAMKSPLLRNYLRRGFSQSLFGKQADLDRALAEYIRKIRSGQKLTKKDKAPTGSFRGIIDIEHAIGYDWPT